MDLSMWHVEVARALRTIEADSPDGAESAAAGLSWLLGENDPAFLSQARVQEFLWFVLPRKFLGPVERKLAVAGAVGTALEVLGLPRYAELCRSERTRQILEAWESNRDAGFRAARKALTESHLDPPDFEGFRWGSVFGEDEYSAVAGVEAALELAMESGVLPKGGRWAKEAHERFVAEWMHRPRPEFEGGSALAAVERERVEAWLGFGPVRRALLEPVAGRLLEPVAAPPGVDAAVAPLQWLLMKIRTGMRVTDRGYLDPAFVRAAAEAWSWRQDWEGPPKSEVDVPQLVELREVLKDLRALRRTGRTVAVTRNGATWASDAEALWRAVAGWIGEGTSFRHAVTELALAVLVAEGRTDRKELTSRVLPALKERGWRPRGSGAGELTSVNVQAGLWQFVRPALLLEMVIDARYPEDWLELTEVGQATALLALRLRATSPRSLPG